MPKGVMFDTPTAQRIVAAVEKSEAGVATMQDRQTTAAPHPYPLAPDVQLLQITSNTRSPLNPSPGCPAQVVIPSVDATGAISLNSAGGSCYVAVPVSSNTTALTTNQYVWG